MRKEEEFKVRNFLSAKNQNFINACERARGPVTRRQASKWLSGKGKAWKEGRK